MEQTRGRWVAWALVAVLATGCAAQPPTPEQAAHEAKVKEAQKDLIAAECKLYEGTGVTPEECKKSP